MYPGYKLFYLALVCLCVSLLAGLAHVLFDWFNAPILNSVIATTAFTALYAYCQCRLKRSKVRHRYAKYVKREFEL